MQDLKQLLSPFNWHVPSFPRRNDKVGSLADRFLDESSTTLPTNTG